MRPARQPGPIRRTIIADRPTQPVGRNPGLRTQTFAAPSMPVRRTRAVPMTGAQRDSTGARSDWAKPASLRPFTTPMTAAWSATVSNPPSPAPVKPHGPRWTP
jgi:hypothetical protein